MTNLSRQPIRFGTDGWRAIIGEDFTLENVARVTRAFATYLNREKGSGALYVGFDRRQLSLSAAKTAAQILSAEGFEAYLGSQYCPTPCVAWNTVKKNGRAGVMITASHNPPNWNGVKFKMADGGAAPPEVTNAVEEILDLNEGMSARIPVIPVAPFDPLKDYVEGFRQMIPLQKIRAPGWRIAYDPLYGAGAGYLGRILEQDIVEIHGEADPQFGGLNPEPIAKNLGDLSRLVRQEGYDVGLATDGDADRIGAVDERGQFVDSHHIFALILRHIASVWGARGGVIKTVSTTQMIDRLAERYHLPLHVTPIGFKHICKKFREVAPLMGGEESGGIAVARWMGERDGLLCCLLLLEIMGHHGKRLGELVDDLHQEIGPHFFLREDLHLDERETERVRQILPEKKIDTLAGKRVLRRDETDGTKFFLANGWLLIRPSGTEPLLRIYAESNEPEQTRNLLSAGIRIVKEL